MQLEPSVRDHFDDAASLLLAGHSLEHVAWRATSGTLSARVEVRVPAGTRLQRSRALPAFGRRGGAEQFQLLDEIPNANFGPGVPFK